MTVNSFMASGGDNFVVLPSGTNRVVGAVDLDALVEYVRIAAAAVHRADRRPHHTAELSGAGREKQGKLSDAASCCAAEFPRYSSPGTSYGSAVVPLQR